MLISKESICQLGLGVAVNGDAGGMDLRVAGVPEVGALAVRTPSGSGVASHGVGREEEHVAVATGTEHDCVGGPGLDLAVDHVAGDDATGAAVNDDQFDHLVARVHLDDARLDLAFQLLVTTDQQLLARLATGVEGALHLHATEGPGVQEAAILAGERNALGDALVDDVGADLRQPVDVGLAGTVIAALDRVVEQPVGGVVVVAVVLRRVDATLGRDGVGATGAVLVAEVQDVVAGLTKGRGGGTTGQAGADDDDAQLASVRRVDETGLELAGLPDLVDLHRGCLGVGDVLAFDPVVGRVESRGRHGAAHFRIPNWTIEIPPKFAGQEPVHPGGNEQSIYQRAEGLAEDVRYYGKWMRDEAFRRIGHLYPKVKAPDGTEHTVIAWKWARTVKSPNPANPIEVPLVNSWWLSKKKGKEAWVRATVQDGRVHYEVVHDSVGPADEGTINRKGAGPHPPESPDHRKRNKSLRADS